MPVTIACQDPLFADLPKTKPTVNRSPTAMINLAKQVSQSLGTPQAMIIGIAADGLIVSASYGDTKLDCVLAGKRLDEIVDFMEKE